MSDVSVSQFAMELNMPIDVLLEQLSAAGVVKSSHHDSITVEDKDRLMRHLTSSENRGTQVKLSRPSLGVRKGVVDARKAETTITRCRNVSVHVKKKRILPTANQMLEAEEVENLTDISSVLGEHETKLRQEEVHRQAELRALQGAELKAKRGDLESEDTALPESDELSLLRIPMTEIADDFVLVASNSSNPIEVLNDQPTVSEIVEPVVVAPVKPTPTKKQDKPSFRSSRNNKNSSWYREEEAVPEKRNKAWSGKGNRQQRPSQRDMTPQQGAFQVPTQRVSREIAVPETITVADLAHKMSVKAAEIIKCLMKMGTMVTINQVLDQDTAILVLSEMGHVGIAAKLDDPDIYLDDWSVKTGDVKLKPRPPIVTVMGHVNHGKTSLLDLIRKTSVTREEQGGITQSIGAYNVVLTTGQSITFLDTPGHEAFAAMRSRGSKVTDIVILVVAADDGVMPQTIEAIEHAKKAKVPLVVAINKIDKHEAEPEKIIQGLLQYGIVSEEYGGDTLIIPISVRENKGIDKLLEAVMLQAEIMELTAPWDTQAHGFLIESSLDKGKGPVATVLVHSGTLRQGDIFLAGHCYGRIRAMCDFRGQPVKEAGPSMPVQVQGLSDIPAVGIDFFVLSDEKKAREIAMFRRTRTREAKFSKQAAIKAEMTFDKMASSGDATALNLVLKADTQGSQEALLTILESLSLGEEVRVAVVYSGVGIVTDSDVNLAIASKACLIAFNVRTDQTAKKIADHASLSIQNYNIIYDVSDSVYKMAVNLLSPTKQEKVIGKVSVRQVFRVPKVGCAAGCYVLDGTVKRSSRVRLLRNDTVLHECDIDSLKRFKEDVKEVKAGFECGITLKGFHDILENDVMEVYEVEELIRTSL